MTTLELLYVALLAVVWPLLDYFVLWPAFLRRSRADSSRARRWIWAVTVCQQWSLVAAGAALWLSAERPWAALGVSLPGGWRLWGAMGLVLLLAAFYGRTAAQVARSPRARASVRRQAGKLAPLLPHTQPELWCFVGLSLTAGFCEEFLFRGYFIGAFEPWLGWWGAAALSAPIFAALHAYQGRNGVLRTGIVGVFFTLVVAVFGSLFPAMALHALVDIGSGSIAWLALREELVAEEVEGVGESS